MSFGQKKASRQCLSRAFRSLHNNNRHLRTLKRKSTHWTCNQRRFNGRIRGLGRYQLTRKVSECPTPFLHRACRSERRSEEHTSELQSLIRISYAVLCLKQNN